MAYSLSHTIPWTGTGTRLDALVYLFDTALASRANTVVSAHPSSTSYRRSVKRTVNSWITGGTYDMYYWMSWGPGGDPAAFSMYNDSKYTTVPGDLGTATTNFVNVNLDINGSSPVNGDFQFWTSDSSDGVMMTQNKTVLFWEPGVTEGMFYPDPTWDGSSDNKGSAYFPWNNSDQMMIMMGAYPIEAALSGTHRNMNVLIDHSTSGARPDGYGEIIAAPPVGWSRQTGTYYPGKNDAFAFFLPQDSVYYYPSSSSTDNRYWGTTAGGYAKVLFNTENSRYYLTITATGMGIDCGTTEPLLT